MTVGLVSDESLSNRLHRMSRENRNAVIGFLRHRYTLIAERLEGFGRELCPLQLLQQQHIGFAKFKPFGDMGQPRANRIQIPTSDLEHRPHSSVDAREWSLVRTQFCSRHTKREFCA